MANFSNTAGGYGYNPLDPGADLMSPAQDRPAMDPTWAAMNAAAQPGNINNWNPLNIAGGVAGATTNFNPNGNSASFLGGAGGPNVAGNTSTPLSANQAMTNYANANKDLQMKDPNAFRIGQNQAYEAAQRANGGGSGASNEQYINSNATWIKNPDFNPLQELRGGAMQAYQQDHSIADKMGYQDNGPAYQREDPFAGQNLNDASVQFHLKQYMQDHPDFVPINTYRGEAPRLPGQINQDTGQMTTEQGSYNPWAANRNGFVQQMPWQGQQQQQAPYQAPQAQQQQNPYLQPFQQTSAYNKAMNQNWGSQPQANNYMGGNQNQGMQQYQNQGSGQNPYGGTSSNNFQSPFQQNQGFGRNQFQSQNQSQGGLLGNNNQFGKNRYGLLG